MTEALHKSSIPEELKCCPACLPAIVIGLLRWPSALKVLTLKCADIFKTKNDIQNILDLQSHSLERLSVSIYLPGHPSGELPDLSHSNSLTSLECNVCNIFETNPGIAARRLSSSRLKSLTIVMAKDDFDKDELYDEDDQLPEHVEFTNFMHRGSKSSRSTIVN